MNTPPAKPANASHPLDAVTGGAFSAPTSGERAARLREWLATDPSAELLAEVYINMTRGQDALLMDSDAGEGEGGGAIETAVVDFSAFDLPVLGPTPEEAEAFEKALQDLDKASGGQVVWKKLEGVL